MFGRNTGKPLKGPTMGAHTIQFCIDTFNECHEFHDFSEYEWNIFFKKMHSPEIDFLFQMNMLLFTMSP